MLRPPLAQCSTYWIVDSLDEEALEHLLIVNGSASDYLRKKLHLIVGHHHVPFFECSDVGVYGHDVFVHRISFEKVVDDSEIRCEAPFLRIDGIGWQGDTALMIDPMGPL